MAAPFAPNSRYAGLAERSLTRPDGTEDRFLARRIIPETAAYVAFDQRRLIGGERIDQIAAEAYGDPLLWWRIADANGDADPGRAGDTPGRVLTLPLPLEVARNGRA